MREFTPDAFHRTIGTVKEGLEEGVAPGFVVGLWEEEDPDQIWVGSWGNRRVLPTFQPMTYDTIFDFASVSKVFATSALAAILVDRRWIHWTTAVRAFFPSFPFPDIQLQHLLSHTAGFPAWEPFWGKLEGRFAQGEGPAPLYRISIEERQKAMREEVFKVSPQWRAGEKSLYSDLSFLILGFALEEATQLPLDRAVENLVWKAMGIDTAFYRRTDRPPDATSAMDDLVAATEKCPWRETILQGQVHDENCWAMGGYGGHSGAFGTVRDLLHFARGLFGGFISSETLNQMWTRVAHPPGCERTLGWDTPSGERPSAGTLFSSRAVGHLGFTGTSLWIDPESARAVALLSNRVHPTRENQKIRAFRPRFHEAICIDSSLRRR